MVRKQMNRYLVAFIGVFLSIISLSGNSQSSDEDFLLLSIVPALAGAIKAGSDVQPDNIRIDYLRTFSVHGCSATPGRAHLTIGIMTKEKIVQGVKVTLSYRVFNSAGTILNRSGLTAITDKIGRANFPTVEFSHSATTVTFTATATDPVTSKSVSLDNISKTLDLDFITGNC